MMLKISWQMTLMALVVVPISGILAAFIVKKSQRYFQAQQSTLGKVNGHIEEMYGGHIVMCLYEMFTGRKPSDKFILAAQMVGMVLLLGLMLLAFGNDIGRLIR